MGEIILQQKIEKIILQHREKKIVAACGCFDIFHIGHLEYLIGAQRLGDILMVGVNSDLSVYENKQAYPIFSEIDRIRIVAALSCVDYVFCFSEKTFDYSLKIIQPKIFARGVDSKKKGFPERDTVLKYHISVVDIGDIKRSSSTELRPYLCKEFMEKNMYN